MAVLSPAPGMPKAHRLIYRPPLLGRDYWILDNALPDPLAVRQRLLQRDDWVLGAPHRPEAWPGQRAQPALTADELAPLEAWARQQTGQKKLFAVSLPGKTGPQFNHNCVQLVGAGESGAKPHTDSRRLCKYAAVLYLNPDVPDHCGTALYRVRLPDGSLGGNTLPARFANLVEALDTRFVPPDLFVEDVAIDHRFNRMLVYKADLIHSATAYWGNTPETKRMSVVMFWMA
ncbi:DUF6445 family protein [Ideonella azotifigens]|uniref:Phytanoyl-CoA dioxygenase family protein n=1 Tax=Ideonella azotifigens TaxID=513160 RepID=A0ABP3VGK6_9BURK|nr:DUF6445 family protein [Ideonella azotifigens]MCD2344313.1 DUF6445 family protein [Ideonella azotifigens]